MSTDFNTAIELKTDPLAIPSEAELYLMRLHANEVIKKMVAQPRSSRVTTTETREPIERRGFKMRPQAKKWRTGWPAPGGLGLNEGRCRGKRAYQSGPFIKLIKPEGGAGLKIKGLKAKYPGLRSKRKV